MNTIYASPVCELEELKDIFVELTAKNCNIRCRQCYIDFPITKTVKDFIKVDTIKKSLEQLSDKELRCIYLTGAEPMTHPDFNTILRLCIKKSNVCICTNASFINEKKSRFLKSVENASEHQILFKLSFAHWDEMKNDSVRSRGAYRQTMFALKSLNKYDFTNIITVSNYYNEPHNVIISNFQEKLADMGIENVIIQITEWAGGKCNGGKCNGGKCNGGKYEVGKYDRDNCDWDKTDSITVSDTTTIKTDCRTSRTLTENGIFSCPFLANDYRGRLGSDFLNYSKSIRLETSFCQGCLKNRDKIFTVETE